MEEEKTEIAILKEKVCKLEECYREIVQDIKEIKEKLLGRPSWFVLIVITFLFGVTSSLVALLLKN